MKVELNSEYSLSDDAVLDIIHKWHSKVREDSLECLVLDKQLSEKHNIPFDILHMARCRNIFDSECDVSSVININAYLALHVLIRQGAEFVFDKGNIYIMSDGKLIDVTSCGELIPLEPDALNDVCDELGDVVSVNIGIKRLGDSRYHITSDWSWEYEGKTYDDTFSFVRADGIEMDYGNGDGFGDGALNPEFNRYSVKDREGMCNVLECTSDWNESAYPRFMIFDKECVEGTI